MISIRSADAGDIAALAELKLVTFRQTFVEDFAIPYPPADLAIFEAEAYGSDKVAAELQDAERRTWIADNGGQPVGYAQVGPCKLPHSEVAPWHGEIHQLYVLREAQGSGLGKALLDIAITHLAATRPGPQWLGVWSGNGKAQQLYHARGFVRVGDYRFRVGNWFDEEYILRRP